MLSDLWSGSKATSASQFPHWEHRGSLLQARGKVGGLRRSSEAPGVFVAFRAIAWKKGWAPKNWYFWTGVLEKTLESPLGCKEIKPVHPKGDQRWIFIGRAYSEVETPILWPLDAKSQVIGKDPDAGKDWGQEEKGTTEDEMIGWHHLLDGREFERALGDSEGQGSLVHRSPWGLGLTTEWQQMTCSLPKAGGGARELREIPWHIRYLLIATQ